VDPGADSVIDFHTHIGDVCRGCYHDETGADVEGFVEPHILERTGYNPLLLRLSASPVLPKSLFLQPAKRAAALANGRNLLASMESSGIGKSLVLPIAPFVSTEEILRAAQISPEQLIPLISVNFEGIAPHEVENQIKRYCDLFPFRGIKFHPNLQKVEPGSQKASVLYESASTKDLFVLIHGGITPVVFDNSRKFSIGKNLLPVLKEHSKTTFVVAHAGGYFNPDELFLRDIADLPNVHVDTSGVGPGTIISALKFLGPERVIFGSDWPYGTQKRSLQLLETAIERFCRTGDHDLSATLQQVKTGNAKRLLKWQ